MKRFEEESRLKYVNKYDAMALRAAWMYAEKKNI